MAPGKNLILFTRPDCHLCELAEEILQACGLNWESVDIESDLGLIRKYGTHIPVLFRDDVDRELFWPFNSVQVMEFVDPET